MAGYLGSTPVPQATQHRESFTATSGQTTFATAGYTAGFVDVYLNGSHLSPADFTATNGSDVVLASGASADDVCDIISHSAFELNAQTFTGTTTMDVSLTTGVLTANGGVVFNEGSADADFRVESNGNPNMLFVDGGTDAVIIGHNEEISIVNASVELSIIGTTATIGVARFGGTPTIALAASASGTVGSFSALSSGDAMGHIFFGGDDGTDIRTAGASISAFVDGTPGGNDMPGRLLFSTTADGAAAVTERMRIDSSGNLLVGTTNINPTANNITSGVQFGDGRIRASRADRAVLELNRKTSDGSIAEFSKDGTIVGKIGNDGSNMFIGKQSGLGFQGNDIISPNKNGVASDNTIDLGQSSARFDDIHATNGTIQTSDRNEKQDIASLTSAEMLVAKRISALFKTFRWKNKVAAKGDNARTHTGIIAQDVQAAFTAESLDSGDYSLFISTTWWEHDVDVAAVEAADAVDAVYREVTDSDGMVTNELVTLAKEAVEANDAYTRTDTYDTEDEAPEGATSKTRMGIRYPELLSFLAAYNEQRFASIETRLTALEG